MGRILWGTVVLASALLAGCGAVPEARDDADAAASPATSASFACPIVEGQEPPEGCIPYDPDLLMDTNERYKDHMAISAEAFAPAQTAKEEIEPALEELRGEGVFETGPVKAVLEDAGLTGISVTGETGGGIVRFDATGPAGGCVFGHVDQDEVEVSIAGYIMDGGCIAAIGH